MPAFWHHEVGCFAHLGVESFPFFPWLMRPSIGASLCSLDYGHSSRLDFVRLCRNTPVERKKTETLRFPSDVQPAALLRTVSQVRSYPDGDEGNVAVNFWFRNVTSFADEERDVLGIGADPRGAEL